MLESEDAPLQTRLSQRPDIISAVCGIGAILDPAGTSGQHAAERMVEALRHRGPDGEALRRIGPLALAHTRLAIIDVAGGDQPLDSEDGRVTAIVNGEIYNHRELRKALEARGHRWATNSDSEVIVHAYEEHGLDCVRHLNGIFAFALWDDREKRLVAARDAFGVKPLYWWSDGRRVALASEIGALLAAGLVEPRVDRTALDHYLACRFVPSPRTLFEGIQKLPPASLLVVQDEGSPRVTSWREAPGAQLDATDDDELADQLAERFTDAVERQMMSDVPYGAFLSGGVDSAGVVAAMKRRAEAAAHHVHDRLPGTRRRGRRAQARGGVRPHHRHRAPRHGDARDRLPHRARADDASTRGAVRHPERARPAAALAVRRGAREGGARGTGRRRAARGLRAPPGRSAAAPAEARARPRPPPPRPGSPARSRARQARAASRTCSAAAGDEQRLLRLVEITDAEARTALVGRAAGQQGEAEHERLDRRARHPRGRARPRPARAGALPRHAHVPAGRDPALQRQDVDGRRPRAARAVPRPRADALRRAHPRHPPGPARASRSASTRWRCRGCSRPRS